MATPSAPKDDGFFRFDKVLGSQYDQIVNDAINGGRPLINNTGEKLDVYLYDLPPGFPPMFEVAELSDIAFIRKRMGTHFKIDYKAFKFESKTTQAFPCRISDTLSRRGLCCFIFKPTNEDLTNANGLFRLAPESHLVVKPTKEFKNVNIQLSQALVVDRQLAAIWPIEGGGRGVLAILTKS